MACKLAANCDLIFGILTCNLLEDTIDVDLKVHNLQGIYTYKKDKSTQVSAALRELRLTLSITTKENDGIPQVKTDYHHPFANRSY